MKFYKLYFFLLFLSPSCKSTSTLDNENIASSELNNNLNEISAQIDSQEDLKKALKKFEDTFAPITAQLGYKLVIDADWNGESFVAHADIGFNVNSSTEYLITMQGIGKSKPTLNYLYGTLCHELGHYMGGYPFVIGFPENQLSIEGQSDYFQSFCLRKLWQEDTNQNKIYRNNPLLPPKLVDACNQVWHSQNEQNLCYRIIITSILLSQKIYQLDLADGFITESDYKKPDPNVSENLRVHEYYHIGYSTYQCRLDTYIAGALCNKSIDMKSIPGGFKELNGDVDSKIKRETHAESTYCSNHNPDLGSRPLCWHKPLKESAFHCNSYGFNVTFDAEKKQCKWTKEFCDEMLRLDGISSFFAWTEGPCPVNN